jgi:hypothetical protein
MFREMDERSPSTCLLNEQSRMAEPICRVVSGVFYDNKLIVAAECEGDQSWLAERRLPYRPEPLGSEATCAVEVGTDGQWSARYGGPIRHESAMRIVELVDLLSTDLDESDMLVITPFRGHRTLLRACLRSAGHSKVAVSTVHRAQGSERHTVIFDPVQGCNGFFGEWVPAREGQFRGAGTKTARDGAVLRFEENDLARRLVNVALSRAKARLIVLFSESDRDNPLLAQIYNVIVRLHSPGPDPICLYASKPNFPVNAVGKPVRIATNEGRIETVVANGGRFMFYNSATGRTSAYVTAVVLKNFKRDCPGVSHCVPRCQYRE